MDKSDPQVLATPPQTPEIIHPQATAATKRKSFGQGVPAPPFLVVHAGTAVDDGSDCRGLFLISNAMAPYSIVLDASSNPKDRTGDSLRPLYCRGA